MKTAIGQAADMATTVAAKDDDDGFIHHAAHGYPPEPVHLGEKVGHGHQQIGAVDLAQGRVRPAAPAIGKGAEGAREERQPCAQIFAAADAAQKPCIRMAEKPLIRAQILFTAGTLKARGIRANAVEQRGGQKRGGPHAQGLKQAGQYAAGRAHVGADVAECPFGEGCRQIRGRMVVNDAAKAQGRKSLTVRGLGIHHGEMVVGGRLFRLPEPGRDAQITDHGQIVRPGHFVDAHDVHAAHLVQHEPLERHSRSQGVRIGIDHDAPAVILAQVLPPLLEPGDIFGIARHDPLLLPCPVGAA